MTRAKRTALVLSLALLAATVQGQDLITFEALTIDATVGGVAITAATITPAGQPQMNQCTGRLAAGQIRYRYDGTAPVAGTGTLLEIGDVLVMSGHANLVAWRGIRTGAVSGVISWHCYHLAGAGQ